MAWGDPKRVRIAVRHKGEHVGYLTTTSYPDRDITAFSEGSPYFEVAVADLAEKHVALFQRFKEHWLIHSGESYGTADTGGELSEKQIHKLAVFALQYRDHAGPTLVSALRTHIERMLKKETGN